MSAARRIAAYTLVAAAVYLALSIPLSSIAPPDTASRLYVLPSLATGAAVAYYLVYMDGYERLRGE